MIAKKTWFQTYDGSDVVPEEDPRAGFLVARAGCHVDDETAKKWDLEHREREPETKAVKSPPSDKAIKGPPSDKGQ